MSMWTVEKTAEFWRCYRAGESSRSIGRRFDIAQRTAQERIRDAGGITPTIPCRAARHLTVEDREEISRGLAAGESLRAIADRIGRPPSTVSREVAANGGRDGYRATTAERAAVVRRRRPKPCKLGTSPRLRRMVAQGLAADWSPEQIAGWLARTYPHDPEMRVSHETIYRTLFIQSRGALKKELTEHLRTRRRTRQPGNANRQRGHGKGQLVDIVSISERPAEADDRAVPGHWEGDLIIGSGASAIGTLVERSTRFTMMFKLEGIKSHIVVAELQQHILTLPEQLRRSVTWDQGKEMALHAQFTIDTGIQIYFCDPQSPWQRGTNENTNRLIRQYYPKKTDLRRHSQADLDAVAAKLNARPRETLGFMTPAEKFAEAVATTH